jgi:hypothetical protein
VKGPVLVVQAASVDVDRNSYFAVFVFEFSKTTRSLTAVMQERANSQGHGSGQDVTLRINCMSIK